MCILTIPYSQIKLPKATMQGLELLMGICLQNEEYEKAAEVRDEIKKRQNEKHEKDNNGSRNMVFINCNHLFADFICGTIG